MKTNFISKLNPLRILSIIIIKYLQKRYKSISLQNRYSQTNQVLNKLILIQSILYYFKKQFRVWGYFHPSCNWSLEDEIYFKKLFPQKDFEELSIVVFHNPEALTYYHNEIYKLNNYKPTNFESKIKKQLIKWDNWN